ncbi:MAG: T9SS type A sorting domain-containing protein, partial [Chitinophagaceae bacterium]
TTLDPNTKYYWRIDASNANGITTGTVWNFRTANIPVTAVGDYRSVASGNWGSTGSTPVSTNIWETFDGTNWNATTVMPSGAAPTVTIRTGHTVKLNATSAVNNLVIESGASIISGTSDGASGTASQRNIRVISSINNFGTVGSGTVTTDRINFEGYKENGTIYITGAGTLYLNTFTVNNIAVNTDVVIDDNLNVAGAMRANFSTSTTLPWTGASQNDDNISITINEGKTVTIGSSGFLQSGSSPTINTIGEFGTYTFNVNGVLDMRGTGTSCVVAHATLAKATTINVNGTWLMGNAIRFIPSGSAAPAGSLALNIGTNGIVDAGARTIGSSNTATNIVVTNTAFNQTMFFNITGGGILKTKVGTSDVSYPIGSGNTYSPVKLNNSGTADIIGVGVRAGFDYPVGDSTRLVNKQYSVAPTTAGVTNLVISLGWVIENQGSAFNPAGALVQGRYNAGAWLESLATLSGAGTLVNPYYAKVNGNTTFGTYAVANATALLDVVAPEIIQPQNIIASNTTDQCSAEISFSATASDNFGVTTLKYFLDYNLASQQEITFPKTFTVGTYNVTVMAKDAADNTAIKTFSITVNDTQKPIARCKSIVVYLDHDGTASIMPAQVDDGSSDNCSAVNVSVLPNSFTATNVGANLITLTVTDASGNTSTCQSTVTVVDNISPDARCKPATITLVNGVATLTAADINNGSSDASGIQSLQVSKASFSCADIGTKTVVLTVTDNNNNVSTCTTTVSVLGEIPSCSITSIPSNNTYTGGVPTNLYLGYGPQNTKLQVSAPASGAPYTYSWSPAAGLNNVSSNAPVFTPTSQGTYSFTVTVTNKYGCKSTCSISICVLDIRVPGTGGVFVYVCQQLGHSGNYHTLPVLVNLLPLLYRFDNGFHLGSCNQTICGSNQTHSKIGAEETVDEHSAISLTIAAFPNPSSGNFTLQVISSQKDPVAISIVNVFGQTVYKQINIAPNTSIIVGDRFAEGVYFVEAKQGDKKMSLKLIKMN